MLCLAVVFLFGTAAVFAGYRGMTLYKESGFSSGSSFHAVYKLSRDMELIWEKQILPSLEQLSPDERTAADRICRELLSDETEEILSDDTEHSYKRLFINYQFSGPKLGSSTRKKLTGLPEEEWAKLRLELLRLLLLDEPLSNLDAKLRESMRFEIKRLQETLGITVIYVTHDQTEAMAMSDRIFVFNRGGLQQAGRPEEIYNAPVNPFVADFLGKIDFFRGTAENGRIVLPGMGGQSVAYSGEKTGKVYVAIRPENLTFTENGELSGKLEAQYYLGDVDDCRVRIGDTVVRVITDGYAYTEMKEGMDMRLSIRDMIIFEDDGSLEEMIRIKT